MDKLIQLFALSLLLASTAAHAEYYQVTGENGFSVGIETLPGSEVVCDKKKEIACFDGPSNLYITDEQGQVFDFTISDSSFIMEDEKIKYEFDLTADGSDSLFVGDMSMSLDISQKKADQFDVKLDLSIEGEHEDYGFIEFDETFTQKSIDFVVSPNPPAFVPVPSSLLLFSSALIGMALIKRKSIDSE
ncbi:PEP-CTERM sorting domain-containing protein [Oceanicoccus sagamiensis]|uniref:PEP-CTERM protein-sorting domain-containing protein n=1 Tax=Oceanicoccus sagamiensis TaxID=716816 RepID=A0A1X9N6L7_9GAMM|nr:PEP-CTERM sorting domain-containing protein [Oceanicoccus sagamiensis]ARN72891.1 hypothetical protein BST96_01475 [Oceanicoccus sagamiensis]